jgi:hypothetical protein
MYSAMSFTPEANLLPVSLTPAINHCPGFPVIAGVVDTGNKFYHRCQSHQQTIIAGDNDTDNKFIARTMTPMNNYCWLQRHQR